MVMEHCTALQDVAIRGGTIVALGRKVDVRGAQVLDASGCYVLPGGVDVHTHFENRAPLDGLWTADDWATGSRAAAAGGVTTVVNYVFQERGESVVDTVAGEIARGLRGSLIDFSVHPIITDVKAGSVAASLAALVREGVTSVKVFTGPEGVMLHESELIDVLSAAARARVLVTVHPEDSSLTAFLEREGGFQAGSTPVPGSAIAVWRQSRPPEVESLAVDRVAGLARFFGTAVYFVHISSEEALRSVVAARQRGAAVYGETRPAYLLLDDSRYLGPDEAAALAVCLPPLRTLRDQRALWDGLRQGHLQAIGSDHTARWSSEKLGALREGRPIPAGFGGVQTGLGLIFGKGLNEGLITVNQFARIVSENPSKLFGLWPRKGRIGVGSDADLVVIDPVRAVEVEAGMLESQSDFDVHSGLHTQGWPVATISRGVVVWQEGKIVDSPGRGRFLRRELVDYGTLNLQAKSDLDQ